MPSQEGSGEKVRHRKQQVILDRNDYVSLSALEEENSDLAQIEVDEMFRLVGDVRTEVSAHDAMPGWVVLLVELFLDVGGNVLLNVVLLKSLK